MIERQEINGREVWIRVDAHPIERENPNIIPREYFTAAYYEDHPEHASVTGRQIMDEEGTVKLFESPVAALSYANKLLGKDTASTSEALTQQTQQEQKESD